MLAGARNRDLAISRLKEGATIPQMEACLVLPDGGTRFVLVAGQTIAMGDEPCMLFTFADLELRKKAETALRQSAERFAKAFRLTPVPTLLLRAEGLAVTGASTRRFRGSSVLGRPRCSAAHSASSRIWPTCAIPAARATARPP
ncbi:hypothetical protein EKPJFOCH_3964 [Methylobacterium thuringiense]|uniref:Uncharacterized protein n=1 Tax=Methylobacterium thuringiense TaxID=1003091 RepID=A0ABQ4TQ09_9HYPH|nr:hypothetical protein EKPJFOCH_3964 [Methylobacterium thuringiense]